MECLNIKGYEDLDYISLNYTIYNHKISIEFKDKISKIRKDIEELKDKLNRYKGHKIGVGKEIEKLDVIYNELIQLENKDITEEKYYQQYPIDVAKGSDVLKNEIATKIYKNSSQAIKIQN